MLTELQNLVQRWTARSNEARAEADLQQYAIGLGEAATELSILLRAAATRSKGAARSDLTAALQERDALAEHLRAIGIAANSPPGRWDLVVRHVLGVLEDAAAECKGCTAGREGLAARDRHIAAVTAKRDTALQERDAAWAELYGWAKEIGATITDTPAQAVRRWKQGYAANLSGVRRELAEARARAQDAEAEIDRLRATDHVVMGDGSTVIAVSPCETGARMSFAGTVPGEIGRPPPPEYGAARVALVWTNVESLDAMAKLVQRAREYLVAVRGVLDTHEKP